MRALLALALVSAEGPCDILVAAGNPCVAAHSTVRALYAAYSGPLYNVTRPDGTWARIGVLEAGGFADIAAHEKFCAAGDCVISNVFDQSPQGNHLGQRHKLVNASTHKISVRGGVQVYGMWFEPGAPCEFDPRLNVHCQPFRLALRCRLRVPRRQDDGDREGERPGVHLRGDERDVRSARVNTGGEPVLRRHYNGGCCFDYGNSETDDSDDGCGAMEAIYFGSAHWVGNRGSGTGPWVGADLEQGMSPFSLSVSIPL